MKKCELCDSPANMYCDSDQASLCWTCDTNVHAANFIVAKHSRTLLCHVCQAPTPWTASGHKLGPTVSVCQSCVNRQNVTSQVNEEEDHEDHEGSSGDGSDEDDDDGDDGTEGGNEDNQVVPFSSPAAAASSSSASDETCGGICTGKELVISKSRVGFFWKRMRVSEKQAQAQPSSLF